MSSVRSRAPHPRRGTQPRPVPTRTRAPAASAVPTPHAPDLAQPHSPCSHDASSADAAASTSAPPPFRLADLGVYGFDRHETAILAALVTEDPLLLVGRSGTGKTFLLNTLSEALGLEHRHYNASLLSFDDLVGFPYPDDAHATVRFLETPATVWSAESVLIDEISRCKPEHQNRLFSLVHERRLQGLPLRRLRYRWAAMNPCSTDQGGGAEDYAGSEPLDPALADRFALVVPAADWSDLTPEQQAAIVAPSGEGRVTPRNERLCSALAQWRAEFERQAAACPPSIASYATAAVSALNGASVRVSPRRARLLTRSLVAATLVAGRESSALWRSVLECSLPHATWGQEVEPQVLAAAHRVAWDASRATADAWIHRFLAERHLHRKLELLLDQCRDPDAGSQAIAQLIANERPDRAAAFAFAVYPAALAGRLPIGAEGVNDLAKLAVPLLDAEGEIAWQERVSEQGTSHPAITTIARVLERLEGTRHARAKQFLTACVVRGIALEAPGDLEAKMEQCVELLRARGIATAAGDAHEP
jgi:MoxR-like ATPase